MVGQYPFAALVGKILDARGPRVCSAIAAVMFSAGFGLFSHEIGGARGNFDTPDTLVFYRLVLYFGMIGLGTVFSFFSTVFAATQSFPNYNGVASGTSMALFGSSPLFLSMIASWEFSNRDSGIDVTQFLVFMSMLTAATHLFGAIALPGPVSKPTVVQDEPIIVVTDEENHMSVATADDESIPEEEPSERSSLLAHNKYASVGVEVIPVQEPQHGSALDLLRDGYFWILTFIVVFTVGSCEMVMANLASIFLSLPSNVDTSSSTIATQIQLLSIANTASRLTIGPLADFVSPVATYVQCRTGSASNDANSNAPLLEYIYSFPRKQFVSRITFLTGAIVLLSATFIYVDLLARSREGLWAMSIGVGFAYGATFTILPGIMSSIWGIQNLGRNFGIISYAPFFGTSIFSYLYAYVAEHRNGSPPGEGHTVCTGVACWQTTFTVCIATLSISFVGSLVLWRRWQGRV